MHGCKLVIVYIVARHLRDVDHAQHQMAPLSDCAQVVLSRLAIITRFWRCDLSLFLHSLQIVNLVTPDINSLNFIFKIQTKCIIVLLSAPETHMFTITVVTLDFISFFSMWGWFGSNLVGLLPKNTHRYQDSWIPDQHQVGNYCGISDIRFL